MSSRTLSTIINFVVGTSEIVNFFIRSACVVSHFTVAISAIYQSVKYTPFAIFFFRSPTLCFWNKLLYGFKCFSVDYRLINILEYSPILFGVFISCFVFKWLGICFEIDNISAILLLRKNFLNSCLTPFVRIGLCFLSASVQSFGPPISHRNKHFVFLQFSCNGFVAFTVEAHFEYAFHNGCGFRVNYPFLFVFRRFHISVRRLR